jgi:translation initiation factor IF-3
MAVSIKECNELSLPVVSDSAPFPEHALIDFSEYSYPHSEKSAKKLRQKAVERNWLYVV